MAGRPERHPPAAGTALPQIQTGAITLTGNQTTDLNQIASAINQSVGSSQGIVATVNSTTGAIDLSTASGKAQTVAITLDASSSTTAGGTTALGVDASYALGSACV